MAEKRKAPDCWRRYSVRSPKGWTQAPYRPPESCLALWPPMIRRVGKCAAQSCLACEESWMDDRSGLVPWTDSQWSQVNRVITEDASKARVAASVLPVFGSLPRSTEVIPRERLQDDGTVDDVDTIQLLELSVEVKLSRQQVEEEDLGSALLLFRWAANLIARTEDWVIFNGMPEPYNKPAFVHI